MTNSALSTLRDMDLLLRNVFSRNENFIPAGLLRSADINYPMDILTTDSGAEIRIAAIGLNREDINVETRPGSISISYDRHPNCCESDECECEKPVYMHKGIARRSFNFQFAVADKLELSKTTVKLEKGELIVSIPEAEEAKPKKLTIG